MASGNNQLYVLLKFLIDEHSAQRVDHALSTIGTKGQTALQAQMRTAEALRREFVLLGQELLKIQDPATRQVYMDRMEQLQKHVESQMATGTMNAAALKSMYANAADSVADMSTEVKVLNKELQDTATAEREFERGGFREAFRWGITGFALTMSGQSIRRIGESLFTPMKHFADAQLKSDKTFQKWQSSTQKMELSMIRIGRVMMSEVLPVIEKVAKLTEDIATFVEAHPAVAAAVAGLGVTASIAGRLMVGFGQVLSGIAAMKSLSFLAATAEGGMGTMGAKSTLSFLGGGLVVKKLGTAFGELVSWMGKLKSVGFVGIMFSLGRGLRQFGSLLMKVISPLIKLAQGLGRVLAAIGKFFVGSVGGAITGGVLAGFTANEALSRTSWGQRAGLQPFGKIATVGAYYAGRYSGEEGWSGGNEQKGMAWAKKVAEWFGYIESSSDGAGDSLRDTASAFDAIAEDATNLYEDFVKDSSKLDAKYRKDVASTESEYGQDVVQENIKYNEERLDIQRDADQKMLEAQQDYQTDTARMTEDFHREQQRAAQEHLTDMRRMDEDFVRDSAQRYADQQSKLNDLTQDVNERLFKLESKFQEDVEKARKDHLKRLEDLEWNHKLRVEELVLARDALGLALEQRNYEHEKSQISSEYEERIAELRAALEQERAEILAEYERRREEMIREFEIDEQRRREDYERQRAEKEEDYQIAAQRRAEDFALQMQERQINFQEEMKQLQEQEATKLAELDASHTKQLEELRSAKDAELVELRNAYQEQKRLLAENLREQMSELVGIQTEGYTAMEEAARAYVDKLLAESDRLEGVAGGTSKAFGGYAGFGRYTLGDAPGGRMPGLPEYVIPGPTTRTLEKLIGGRITNQALLGLASGSTKVGNAQIVINSPNALDERSIGPIVEKYTYRAMRRALDA